MWKNQHLEKPKVKVSDYVRALWCGYGYWTCLGSTLLFKGSVNESALVNQGSEGVHSSASKHEPCSASKKEQACAACAVHVSAA